MAHSKKLISFISENADRIDLNVSELTWFQEHQIPISDIEVTFLSNGKTRKGRGTATTPQLAVIKAFAEAAERDVMNDMNWPSSNGVAAHTTLEEAKLAARSELLERDAFFRIFRAGEAFGSKKAVANSALSKRALEVLETAGVEARESTVEYSSLSVSLVTLLGSRASKRFGLILGLAAHSDAVRAFEHALIEAMRFFAVVSTSDEPSALSVEEFVRIQFPTLADHGRLGLDINYANWFEQNYLTGTVTRRFTEPEISFQVVDNRSVDGKAPLYVVRANAEDAHQLYIGFANESVMPHPFW